MRQPPEPWPRVPTEQDAACVAWRATGRRAAQIERFATGLSHFVYDVLLDDGRQIVVRLTRMEQAREFAGAVYWYAQLKPLSVEPTIVTDGREALEKLRAGGYDAVTLDVLMPDMDTLRRMPWHPGSVLVIADLTWLDGAPVVASPRQILKAQTDRLAARGWTAFVGTELEFVVYQDTYEQAAARAAPSGGRSRPIFSASLSSPRRAARDRRLAPRCWPGPAWASLRLSRARRGPSARAMS